MRKSTVRDTSPKSAPETVITSTALLDLPETAQPAVDSPLAPARKRRSLATGTSGKRFASASHDEHGSNHQAELFYLQKQIQLQTQMIFVLEDGQRVQGVVEWYDRNTIKVRGKARVLIYKSAIKYLYKVGETGMPPEK